MPKPVIISCAITGSIHVPSMSPHRPITPAQIAGEAIAAAGNILLGGNRRVGLEDSLYLDRGRLAVSNAEQVERIKSILHLLGYDVATPAQARERLALKGAAETRFSLHTRTPA